MATHHPPSSPHSIPTRIYGRIRVDDPSSFDLLHILQKELREADLMRRRASELEQDGLINEVNRYMRRIRRMIRETTRTRAEMGWDEIELTELARRE